MRQLDSDLWVAERPLTFMMMALGTRMTVIRLADGSLFLHSPVELDAATRAEVDARGAPQFIVAPNLLHHLYAGAYLTAYPRATAVAAPGLARKRADLKFHGVLGGEAHPGWAGQIDQLLFAGMPALNEVVFLHRASRTLILTDLAFNVRRTDSVVTRILLTLDDAWGKFGPSRISRLFIRDRRAARAALDRIMQWDFDRIIVSHGEIVEHGGRHAMNAAFAGI